MSQAPQSFGNDDFSAPKQGMSGTTKMLLGLGIGCGVVALICCGGFIALTTWGASIARNAVVESPEDVEALAQSIVTIDVPPELKPRMGMNLEIPFMGPTMKMALFAESENQDEQQSNVLMIGEVMVEPYQPGASANVQNQIDDAMRQQGRSVEASEKMETVDTREVEATVRDQPAKFVISKLKSADSGKEVYQASGAFAGEKGTGFMTMVVDADKFSEEQVEAVVSSIK